MHVFFCPVEVGGELCLEPLNLCPEVRHPQDVPNVLCMANPTTARKTHIQKSINGTVQINQYSDRPRLSVNAQ